MSFISYPYEFLRGMSNKDFVSKEGYVLPGAFQFDPVRADGYCELSINWLDDKDAITVAANQINPRTNDVQFKAGIAKLNRLNMEMILKTHFMEERLCYERSPIEEDNDKNIQSNPYHGNLLLKDDTSPQLKKLIQATLSAIAGNDIIQIKS